MSAVRKKPPNQLWCLCFSTEEITVDKEECCGRGPHRSEFQKEYNCEHWNYSNVIACFATLSVLIETNHQLSAKLWRILVFSKASYSDMHFCRGQCCTTTPDRFLLQRFPNTPWQEYLSFSCLGAWRLTSIWYFLVWVSVPDQQFVFFSTFGTLSWEYHFFCGL